MAKPRTYTGTDTEVSFDMSLYIHARNCFLTLPDVFDPSQPSWVQSDAAPAEEIAAMIRTCPSGALQFKRLDGGVEVTSGTGTRIARAEKLFLRRCGVSENKPFCDGSHKAAGFVAPALDEG